MSGTTCKRNRPTMAETPTQVIADSDHHNSKCYMWVHRSGEFYTRRPIVIYEYQKGRNHLNNPVSMSPLSGDRKPQIRF